LVVLQAHYRAPIEVTTGGLEAAERTLRGIDAMGRRLAEAPSLVPAAGAGEEVIAAFRGFMDDDLATPQAMAVLFDALKAANSAFDRGDGASGLAIGRAVFACFDAVGMTPAGARAVEEDALELARLRDGARASRDWAAADRLRDEIVALGYSVEDTAGGTRVYR
jgi:cysteinyl-tRNA synthetase